MSKSKFDPEKHHRRSIRLPNYDYSQPGAYFATIVTWHRECLFGDVVAGEMKLNEIGRMVQWEWKALPQRFRYIELGAYVVMPNHFHGILIFHEYAGASRQELTNVLPGRVSSPPMTKDGFEGSPLPRGPKQLWKIPSLKDTPIWQRNYYEHVIRNDQDLQNKTSYINANPILWSQDEENPVNIKE